MTPACKGTPLQSEGSRTSSTYLMSGVFHIAIAMVPRRPEHFLVYSRCEKLGSFRHSHMAGTLVPDVVGTEYSVQGVSKYVAFEAQNLTVMQTLGRAHGVRSGNFRTRNPP
jgi:hypothetical protein